MLSKDVFFDPIHLHKDINIAWIDTEYWKAFLKSKNNQELQTATKKNITLQYYSWTMQANWNSCLLKGCSEKTIISTL